MKKTIMVVDDEPDIRESIKTVLEKNGYAVVTAVDGDDCMKKLPHQKVDLVLMDIMMPGTPVKKIVPKIKGTKVVYLSIVRLSEAEKENLLASNHIIGFIEKPVDINFLLKQVKKFAGS